MPKIIKKDSTPTAVNVGASAPKLPRLGMILEINPVRGQYCGKSRTTIALKPVVPRQTVAINRSEILADADKIECEKVTD